MGASDLGQLIDFARDPLGWGCGDQTAQRVEGILDRLCGHDPDGRVLLPFRQPLLGLLDPDGERRPSVSDIYSRAFMRHWLWPIAGDENTLDRIEELIDTTEQADGLPGTERSAENFVDEYTWEAELEDWCDSRWDPDEDLPIAEVA